MQFRGGSMSAFTGIFWTLKAFVSPRHQQDTQALIWRVTHHAKDTDCVHLDKKTQKQAYCCKIITQTSFCTSNRAVTVLHFPDCTCVTSGITTDTVWGVQNEKSCGGTATSIPTSELLVIRISSHHNKLLQSEKKGAGGKNLSSNKIISTYKVSI